MYKVRILTQFLTECVRPSAVKTTHSSSFLQYISWLKASQCTYFIYSKCNREHAQKKYVSSGTTQCNAIVLINPWKVKVLVAQLCSTLGDPLDCNLPGSSVHAILQARILEWVAIPFSGGHFQPRNQTQVSRIADRLFTVWATKESPVYP